MGHLPFEAEVTDLLNYGAENRITVMCDNALIQTTVPQGRITEVPNDGGMTIVQSYTFDFFNYAGIHRSVHLYTTPRTFIEEVEVTTNLSGDASGKILEFIIRESTEISGQEYIYCMGSEKLPSTYSVFFDKSIIPLLRVTGTNILVLQYYLLCLFVLWADKPMTINDTIHKLCRASFTPILLELHVLFGSL